MKKFLSLISIMHLIIMLTSLAIYPAITPTLGMFSLLLSLALSTYAIYTKHAESEHARAKILKEVGMMALTLIAVIFLGGIAGMLANAQVSVRWGEIAGIVSALGASFLVGYFVRKGVMKLAQ